MEQRRCGPQGLFLSVLGAGCWSFGGSEQDYWGAQDGREAEAVVRSALAQGVTYFDTAEGYNDGRSETALAQALGSRRGEAIIGSKVSTANAAPHSLRAHCEASLRRLGSDYLDVYMLHWPVTAFPAAEVFGVLAELQTEGKIRFIGVSNYGAQQLCEAAATGVQISVNQVCYNLLSRAIEFEIVPECQRMEIGIIGYMPLQQGLLTGKYSSPSELPEVRARTRHFSGSRPQSRHGEPGAEVEIFRALDAIRVIAAEVGRPMQQVAISWAAHKPGITCALTGIRNLAQLDDAVQGANLALPAGVMARLDEATEVVKRKLGPNADYYQSTENSRVK
jgi:aryl-alcohol dehydrogenase-like predicted oxidoreductase